MFNEKIIQISGQRALTNKGRIFEQFIDHKFKTFWSEIELPELNAKLPQNQQPNGKTKFIEGISNKEKFNNAKSVGDLLDA